MRFRLDGRVTIVTGASSGWGVAFAHGFAEAGSDLVICARRADRLSDTAEELRAQGRRCLPVPADVTDVEDCERVVEAAMEAFGRIDVLVNNAGIGNAVPAVREDPDDFR